MTKHIEYPKSMYDGPTAVTKGVRHCKYGMTREMYGIDPGLPKTTRAGRIKCVRDTKKYVPVAALKPKYPEEQEAVTWADLKSSLAQSQRLGFKKEAAATQRLLKKYGKL